MDDKLRQQGRFSWNELLTTDVEGAKAFYSALFGWGMNEYPMPGFTYATATLGGDEVAGIMPMPAEAQGMPPHWGSYVTVDDVDATAVKVQELGGRVVVPPQDIPGVGRFAVFMDPQGAFLSIMTYAPGM